MAQWLMASATWICRPALNLIRALQVAQSRRRARFENRAIRGITLLREWLSTQQRRQLDSYDYFEVVGCDSGKSYRIQHGVCQNVLELNADGRPRMGWIRLKQLREFMSIRSMHTGLRPPEFSDGFLFF